jgi:hypothetical protein
MPPANWWVGRGLGHGAEGAWLARAGELIERFPCLGDAVRRGEVSLDHLRVLDEIHDRAVIDELVREDGELCRIARRSTSTNWRRAVRRRVESIRDQLAATADEATPEGGAEADRRPGGSEETSDPAAEPSPDDASGGDEVGGSGGGLLDGPVDPDGPASCTSGPIRPGAGSASGPDGTGPGGRRGDLAEEGWLSLHTTAEGVLRLPSSFARCWRRKRRGSGGRPGASTMPWEPPCRLRGSSGPVQWCSSSAREPPLIRAPRAHREPRRSW